MRADWQSLVTLAIGLMAAGYLARRWWPAFKGLLGSPSSTATTPATTCSTPSAPSASCSSGCGNCGSGAPSSKDHRVHIVARKQA